MQMHTQDIASLFVAKGQDWTSKAIIAALDNKGVSLREIEKKLGLSDNSIRNVFYRKTPNYQLAIANEIGIKPEVIWPSRYSDNAQKTA